MPTTKGKRRSVRGRRGPLADPESRDRSLLGLEDELGRALAGERQEHAPWLHDVPRLHRAREHDPRGRRDEPRLGEARLGRVLGGARRGERGDRELLLAPGRRGGGRLQRSALLLAPRQVERLLRLVELHLAHGAALPERARAPVLGLGEAQVDLGLAQALERHGRAHAPELPELGLGLHHLGPGLRQRRALERVLELAKERARLHALPLRDLHLLRRRGQRAPDRDPRRREDAPAGDDALDEIAALDAHRRDARAEVARDSLLGRAEEQERAEDQPAPAAPAGRCPVMS
jgi:hypothetical protein